jgi:hypothetical protein
MPIKLKQVLLLKKDSQLTPWSRVLLVKLTLPQLAKKFPAFYGTQWFITHLPLPSNRQIQSTPSHPNTIFSSMLGLPNGIFPSGFPTKTLNIPHLVIIGTTCPAHLILLDLIT